MTNLKLITGLSESFVILLAIVTLPRYATAVTDNETASKPCEKWDSEELVNKEINEDGSITSNGITYRKNEIYKESNVSRGCMCLNRPCIRKCCPLDQVYKFYEGENGNITKCVNEIVVNFLSELKYYEFTAGSIPKESNDTNNISIVNEELLPYCPERKMKIQKNNFILTNGSLLIQDDTNEGYKLKTINDYCADLIGDTVYYFTCLEKDVTNTPMYFLTTASEILFIIVLITIPLLIITFLVYYFFPDLHNLVGRNFCCLTFSKIINYIAWLPLYKRVLASGDVFCVPLGYIMAYSIFAQYSWLNVLCFDIWQAFRENQLQNSFKKYEEKSRSRRRFIYGWGVPAVICLIMFTADKFPTDYPEFKPMVGSYSCFINNNNKAAQVFITLPKVIILILNWLMFFSTASKIYAHKKKTSAIKGKGRSTNDQNYKERLIVFFKLFAIMGIAMTVEPLGLLFNQTSNWSLILCDLLSPLSDTILFAIFVCKRHALEKIATKLCPSKNFFNRCNSTNVDSNKTETTTES